MMGKRKASSFGTVQVSKSGIRSWEVSHDKNCWDSEQSTS